MFSNLQDNLDAAFKNLSGDGKLTEINVATSVKAIRRALVDADVNYKIAKSFTDKVKDEALGKRNVLKSVRPGDLMVKIVQDELVELMGGQAVGINIKANPGIVLIAGLQGSGKTTFTGKLSRHLKNKRSKKVMVIACDVYRPAAINQLAVVAEQVGVDIYKEMDNKNPVEIALNGIAEAKKGKYDVVIVDTAGRLAVDEEMMTEIAAVKEAIQPTETLFVVDSMTGQDAVNTAKAFNDRINYDGVVLTKLDGDTRGGAALSIKYTVGKPIKFISMGEKMDTLDIFHPDRMAQRILGMGDIISLVEKAQEDFDEKEAKRLEKKIRKNEFDFNDFLKQLAQIRKMGNLKSLIGMIPGMGKIAKDIDIDDNAFNKIEAIILSMTPEERENPGVINGSRKKRIAKGSGNRVEEINQFLRQFEQMRKMMFQMSKMQAGGGNMRMPNIPRGFR
ncbi:signal recognition particle protein [Saprospira grandis DSM 2844]|uniref:Signal recognition particle protein n=1 Tax=Saprospira grandis DSM 2844 TaxID=694433 RepID=J0NXC7_9BACT|nr:signal recognition particle protein [Saprospira grandis]EJF52134.1 signal recognition particle protein [Saprospira grandis DSM 2844]